MSRHATFRDAVRTKIATLTLTGIDAANIVTRKVPVDRNLTLPGIVICAFGQETFWSEGNSYTSVGYPVAVVIHEASNQVYTADDTELTWRQTIFDAFHKKGGAVVSGAEKVEVECGPIIDLPAWEQANLALSFLTIRCYDRVNR